MPANGTSRIREIFRPVKKPPGPSFIYNFLIASVKPLYSEKPSTSNLVLITIIGLDSTDYIPLAVAEAQKLTQ